MVDETTLERARALERLDPTLPLREGCRVRVLAGHRQGQVGEVAKVLWPGGHARVMIDTVDENDYVTLTFHESELAVLPEEEA